MPRIDELRTVTLFKDLDEASLLELEAKTRSIELRRGDFVFKENDESRELFVVVHGRLAMVNRSFDGRESVVALMQPGDLFGEMPMFDGQNRSTDGRCLEPSELVAIPYEAVMKIYSERPAMLWRAVELLTTRLRKADSILADSVFLDVTGRTAKRLLEVAGDANDFSLPVTQEELAGMIGASRERVNKAIASFVKLGWIEQRDRRYFILNRDQLELRSR